MRTYWDLDEKQRAALASEDVERFIDAELMLKGVLRVDLPALVPEPDEPEPDTLVYVCGSYGGTVAFPSAEAFEKARALGMMSIESKWFGSDHAHIAEPFLREPTATRVFSPDKFAQHKHAVERAKLAKAANESARKQYACQLAEQEKALAGMWEDWHRCRALASRMEKIGRTFSEYTATAGDPEIASKFLSKVFNADDIADAAKWCGFFYYDPGAAECVPQPPPEPAHEQAPF